MSIGGMLTIVMYALAPFMWQLIGGVFIMISAHLLAYLRGYQVTRHHSRLATFVIALIILQPLVFLISPQREA